MSIQQGSPTESDSRKNPFLIRRFVRKHVYHQSAGKGTPYFHPQDIGSLSRYVLRDFLVEGADGRLVEPVPKLELIWDTGAYISVLPKSVLKLPAWTNFIPVYDDKQRPIYMTLHGLFSETTTSGQVGHFVLGFKQIPDRKFPMLCALSERECDPVLHGSFILESFALEPGELIHPSGTAYDGYHLIPRDPTIGISAANKFEANPFRLVADTARGSNP